MCEQVPDITPPRIGALDVASLTDIEVRAALVHLAGDPDPAVAAAVLDAVRRVLERTRGI
jgi:hypothetical protein